MFCRLRSVILNYRYASPFWPWFARLLHPWWCRMVSYNLENYNDVSLPNGTKPLPEPMLTYQQWGPMEFVGSRPPWSPWASYQIGKIAGWLCAENPGKLFHCHRLQRKPLVSDPGMHHSTCVTHVPWCMWGSLTRGGGENVPGIPGACATRNFVYLVRGPWL